ncbi:LD-carboxypeptidase [Mariniflexile sp. AS56]|uniref:S66 peptidase family protein n=1 Tax=Mariniflexile sp. AS56 TaxID=3063957 RepID=UPI0026F1E2C7|nr:LD-carboxypeptidase [Mariniflexile sp. AS56]MDO7172257.1 LD-carboxypeptidase [Mariniflexile sp. AS56]
MYIYIMSRITLITILLCAYFFCGNTNLSAQNTTITKSSTLIRPPYLKIGDTVAIVAPSGVLRNRTAEVEQAKNLLETWGLHVQIGKNVFNQNYHFAGTDTERWDDLQKAMDDPKISAIWSARGGYGTVRILDKLNYSKFRKHPKWIIGYSDITALHNQVHNEGFESLHAMMCTSLQDNTETIKETITTFKEALFGTPLTYTLEGSKYNKPGTVSGQLVGGNLTILHTMLGSKTSINTAGKILFIEEIGEYEYHIDRMLQSLKRAGYFDHCKGVLVGDITKVRRNTTAWGVSVEQLILDILAEYNIPVAFNMPAGHEKDNRALIFGRTVELTVTSEKSTVVFHK